MVIFSFAAFAFEDLTEKSLKTEITVTEKSSVQVYPNPFNASIHINSSWVNEEAIAIRIFNIIGKEIYFKRYEKNTYEIDIDTTTFEEGIYFIKISNGINMYTQRIIKK